MAIETYVWASLFTYFMKLNIENNSYDWVADFSASNCEPSSGRLMPNTRIAVEVLELKRGRYPEVEFRFNGQSKSMEPKYIPGTVRLKSDGTLESIHG